MDEEKDSIKVSSSENVEEHTQTEQPAASPEQPAALSTYEKFAKEQLDQSTIDKDRVYPGIREPHYPYGVDMTKPAKAPHGSWKATFALFAGFMAIVFGVLVSLLGFLFGIIALILSFWYLKTEDDPHYSGIARVGRITAVIGMIFAVLITAYSIFYHVVVLDVFNSPGDAVVIEETVES